MPVFYHFFFYLYHMTFLYDHPCFLDHDTGSHPECAQRLRQISERLHDSGLAERCERPEWEPASSERLQRVHGPDYLAAVQQFAAAGGGRIEADTLVSPSSFEVARQAAGAVADAVVRVTRGEGTTARSGEGTTAGKGTDPRALCLVRPPGHHALPHAPMGFCLLNNVAIGARVATRELGLDRVLIVDWDVHHGNGTQDAFWEDGQVGFLSIHRWPFYPGTGSEDQTGAGPGLGTTRNLPIEMGTPRDEYLARFSHEAGKLADKIRPQLVLISAGFDSHREDPIGSLGLESEDFIALTRTVLDIAAVHAAGRVVSVLEGGYNPPVLAQCVELHLKEMLTFQG